ncbi:hypothetical protein [Novosphingobium lentum]|uniref:hypothetical protein n=1 Tax=Novosphingobium lentum TaxID=145287 RepID=UPI000833B494|nr:hypothetical protein [Novosphingobium lentum]
MPSPAHDSSRTLAEARQTLARQQAGGRRSIGQRSADLKRQHYAGKLARLAMAIGAIVLATMVAGMVINGIGLTGLFVAVLAVIAASFVFGRYPRMKVPDLATLNTGDVRQMVGRTELWLEAQRPALPAPAVQLVDQIGVQLDALGLQLQGIDQAQPAAQEVRKLVGEHLPGMVASYRRIPAHLRSEQREGRSADQQLADGLGKISREIDDVTRQLAAGDLDALAIQGRFLDYKYGGAIEGPPAAGAG